MANVIDLWQVYSFIRKITTSFDKWEAYKTGVIDKNGNILVSKASRSADQRSSFNVHDLMILKLKKLLNTIPGGSSKIGTYFAALWLIREWNEFSENSLLTENISEETLDHSLLLFSKAYSNYTTQNLNVNKIMNEETAVAGGNIAGLGVGPQGEPGRVMMKPTKMFRRKTFKDFIEANETLGDRIMAEPGESGVSGSSRKRAYVRRIKRHPVPTVRLT